MFEFIVVRYPLNVASDELNDAMLDENADSVAAIDVALDAIDDALDEIDPALDDKLVALDATDAELVTNEAAEVTKDDALDPIEVTYPDSVETSADKFVLTSVFRFPR